MHVLLQICSLDGLICLLLLTFNVIVLLQF